MDYKKKYNEALERAKEEFYASNSFGKGTIEYIFPELQESEEENTRKRIIALVNAHGQGMYKDDMLAWLENIPYTIDHEKREGFHLGYKAALEKQGKSSDQMHYWTEEEIEPIISDYLRGAEHYGGMIGRLRCLKPKPLTVDIESMIEAYEQRLINQGNGVRNSPIVNMCVASFKHGIENTLDELHLKQGETSPTLSNSSNIGKDEQKPTETAKWSSQEESCICQLESLVKEQWRHAEKVNNAVDIKKMQELMFFLKTLNPNKKPQRMISAEAKEAMYDKPACAWNEEDKKMCQETIDWFEKKCFPYALESENPARESINWLKSLKQRIGG